MILCCGEALIDMVPGETVGGAAAFVPHPGGAVFNTAIALGRLGVRCGLLTGLSRDMFGRQLADSLDASGVDRSCVVESDRPTTLAFVRLVDGHASYAFHDENSAGRMLRPADLPTLPAGVPALYFGGISLACEPAADTYAALLAREGAGRLVMIDPNIRPGFAPDAQRYRARLDGMIQGADIVKVSDEDLSWLMPGARPLRDKAGALLEQGPALVVVTRGGDGATGYLAKGTEVHVPAPEVTVVDTVGAGDTFNAGLLARLSARGVLAKDTLRGLSASILKDALEHGARVAAITVSRAGADSPWADEL